MILTGEVDSLHRYAQICYNHTVILLSSQNFIRFMNQREHTLSNMLIRLTYVGIDLIGRFKYANYSCSMKFAEVNKRHIHGTPGQPPTALLCTADFVVSWINVCLTRYLLAITET